MPTVTNLFVETSSPVSGLVDELRRLADDFGLDYGLMVTRLEEQRYSMPFQSSFTGFDPSVQLLSAPLAVYKVYVEDGRMEPVRGLVFDEVTVRSMRDVGMLGDDPRLTNLRLGSLSSAVMISGSIITPSILVEEMDLKEDSARETVLLSGNPMFGE